MQFHNRLTRVDASRIVEVDVDVDDSASPDLHIFLPG